jgi:hypothetical protein
MKLTRVARPNHGSAAALLSSLAGLETLVNVSL